MKKITFILLLITPFILKADHWTRKADFGGTARVGCAHFSIGNKGYIGLGTDQYPVYHFVNDLWEYDQAANTWTQKADFPGTARYTPLSFGLATKGYVGVGWNGIQLNDLWEYDQATNSWTQKGNFPGPIRQNSLGIVVNNKAFAGMGNNGSSPYNDWYSYNDTTDTWIPLANFSGTGFAGFGFGINGKIYIGTELSALWEYDPGNDTWTPKTNFPGAARQAFTYFSINNKGYAGIGRNSSTAFYDFYVYDPVLNSWAQRTSFPDTSIHIEEGFAIGSLGYSGCGKKPNVGSVFNKEFWEYTPDSTTSISELSDNESFSVFPNPVAAQVTVNFRKLTNGDVQFFNSLGELLEQTQINSSSFIIDISNKPKGIYFISVTNEAGNKAVKKIVKM